MLMVDLGAGLKGASQAMKERGWEVITLDIDPRFNCTITADVLTWNPLDVWRMTSARQIDLLWFSMPCDEFSRESMPWSRTYLICLWFWPVCVFETFSSQRMMFVKM